MVHAGLTFRDAAMLAGEKHPAFKAINRLLDGALLLGTAGGSDTALSIFDAKNEFVKHASDLGNSLVETLKGLDRFERTERIEAASSVLIVVSFFEVLGLLRDREYFLDEEALIEEHDVWGSLPVEVSEIVARTVRRRVRSAYQEQDRLAGIVRTGAARRDARRRMSAERPTLPEKTELQILLVTSLQPRDSRIASVVQSLIDSSLPVPAPHKPFEVHLQELTETYRELAVAYAEASLGLDWETLEQQEQARYRKALSTWVSQRATRRYESHFQKLAGLSPEVAYWANAIDHQATRGQIEELRIGLRGLRDAMRSDASGQMGDVAAALTRVYQTAMNEPVVATNDLLVQGMQLPRLQQIYVNPDFRVLSATPGSKLELESTWSGAFRRDDIQSFLVGYFSAPSSSRVPLLLLGQPGSGKSVLTKVLAASLPENEYLPIRITLREIPAHDEIQSQIEASVLSSTGQRVQWTDLVGDASGITPVVIFDGFDELLQATGVAQSDYLERVAKFQERETSLGRPCVAVVTSRTAVADRARIPHPGITAVRIEPFSVTQIESWVRVWNSTNANFFRGASLQPLSNSAVLTQRELAEQPLLLLMLALYDANDNALWSLALGEDRTSLYEKLLRAFTDREIEKSFAVLKGSAQEELIQSHINDLSIAALAMFNRGRQWVLVQELNDDMRTLGGEEQIRPVSAIGFRPVTSAGEALIGKFFFVHEARAIVGETTIGTIEFLHATFGEYLVARAVHRELSHVLDQEAFSRKASRRAVSSDGLLVSLLSSAALSSRATILEFLQEMLEDMWSSRGDLLREVLTGFFQKSLQGRSSNQSEDQRSPGSQLAASANYSFNLLAILLLEGRRVDASELFTNSADPNDAWSRHAQFLRSQLPTDSWVWLTENVLCERSLNASVRVTVLQKRKVVQDGAARREEYATPSDWHHGLVDLGDGSLAELDSHERVIRSVRLATDPDTEMALRCVEPLASEVGEMLTLALIGPDGVRVTGAEALVRLWVASSSQASGPELAAAYSDCIWLGLRGPGVGGDNFRNIVRRQLANDLRRLPGEWREQMRALLDDQVLVENRLTPWAQMMIQSLGLGRFPDSSRQSGV